MPASAVKSLSLSPRAAKDIAAIEAYYEQFGIATADRIVTAIRVAAESLRLNPSLGTEGVRNGTRQKVVGRYPYTIVYRAHQNGIQIIPVLHQRREYFNPSHRAGTSG